MFSLTAEIISQGIQQPKQLVRNTPFRPPWNSQYTQSQPSMHSFATCLQLNSLLNQ